MQLLFISIVWSIYVLTIELSTASIAFNNTGWGMQSPVSIISNMWQPIKCNKLNQIIIREHKPFLNQLLDGDQNIIRRFR